MSNDHRTQGTTAGAYSLAEILSQPECWSACLKLLDESRQAQSVLPLFEGSKEALFIGCGSSYYAAQSGAAAWTSITGTRARAIPASEWMLYSDLVLTNGKDIIPVLISRSGRTSEVLKVAESLRSRQIPSLGITCATGQQLERLATATICLAPADERSTVMTRSFTSMLLGITDLAARMRGNGSLLNQLRELPRAVASVLNTLPKRVREFVDEYRFDDYVCLGQGPLYGIACESALKLTEMSVSYGQSFHTLEFRHGPKSIVSPRTLILFLLSERGYESECEVLEEVKQLGGTTMVVANHVEPHARASADFLLELGLNVPEIARLVAYLCAAQLMGLYTGLKKGLDPDHPRNLSRVVLLEESNPETHAAI